MTEPIGLNLIFEEVKKFHKTFDHPIGEKPCRMEKSRAGTRLNWMIEELNEFYESGDMVDQADAMIDLIYFAIGTLVEMGIKPQRLFEIVQQANMSKVWLDGKAHYDQDGKVIKPADWKNPEPLLRSEIVKQINYGSDRPEECCVCFKAKPSVSERKVRGIVRGKYCDTCWEKLTTKSERSTNYASGRTTRTNRKLASCDSDQESK